MKVLGIFAAVMMWAGVLVAADGAVLGEWKTANDKSKVDIHMCGDKICGKIVWLKEPKYVNEKDGPVNTEKTDRNNPDASLRTTPILGLMIMKGFSSTGANTWGGGTIYDPDNGKTYKCKMELAAPNKLKVRGYIGISAIGRTTEWTR